MSLPNLRDLLAHHFSLEELRGLCFDLGLEYEDLPGETRPGRAQSLIEYCLRRGRLPELHRRCTALRPLVDWPDLPALAGELDKVQEAETRLQEILTGDQLVAALAPLRQKEMDLLARLLDNPAGVQASLHGSGAVAQGEGATAVGERGVVGQAELIITGDNVSVQTIIQQYGEKKTQPPDAEALQAQIGSYLTWLQDWAGTLELRGIQRQGEQVVQLPLEQVYVPLAAELYSGRQASRISFTDLLSLEKPPDLEKWWKQRDAPEFEKRLILTGGPGSGKTTVLLHIAWTLACALAADDVRIAADKVGFPVIKEKPEALPLPIFVPLSLYAAHRRGLGARDDRTLAAFISHFLFDRQASFALPDDFFRHLLRSGKTVILLLDGLDEVPDDAERAQVRQAIEDLVTGRDEMRVVVSCRTAAYQGRTALGRGFRQVTVQPLAAAHIAALVTNAYAHLYRHDSIQRRQKTTELLQGVEQLEGERRARLGKDTPRLIDSPLLVRMLLIVHCRERRLPEQRAELYMKATDTMLLPDYAPDTEVADSLGRLVGGSWEVHRDLVQHLAFHMHQRGEQQGREISETDLRRLLKVEPAFAPLVEDFIALTRLRGTLLEERLGRYRFLHLAFQEFLAARYLATIKLSEGGIQTVAAFLEAGPLRESWWREVILLVAGYFAVTSPQTAHTFLERLAGVDNAAPGRPVLPLETQTAAAELAALAWLEWPLQPGQRESLRQKIGLRFDEIFEQIALKERTDICRRLARTVDLRPGVGTVLRSGQRLPDIVMGGEVPAGTYTIGGDKQAWNSRDQQEIEIQHPYRLARYAVTHAQFQCFVDAPDFDDERWWLVMPAEVKDYGGTVYPRREITEQEFPFANHPRERVSWYQAMAFCRWLTARLHAGALPAGALTGDVGQYKITLPHEYEWEVAARWPNSEVAGRLYPWGPKFDAAKANTAEGDIGQTTAVGIYPAGRNAALGLYDLSGNVWEWCRNKYYNPEDEAMDGSVVGRVVRGGSWFYNADVARAASRYYFTPAARDYVGGFRLVVVGGGGASSPIS